jgi:hypothetical protein
VAHESGEFMRGIKEVCYGMAVLAGAAILTLGGVIVILLIVPTLDCLVHGTPFFRS